MYAASCNCVYLVPMDSGLALMTPASRGPSLLNFRKCPAISVSAASTGGTGRDGDHALIHGRGDPARVLDEPALSPLRRAVSVDLRVTDVDRAGVGPGDRACLYWVLVVWLAQFLAEAAGQVLALLLGQEKREAWNSRTLSAVIVNTPNVPSAALPASNGLTWKPGPTTTRSGSGKGTWWRRAPHRRRGTGRDPLVLVLPEAVVVDQRRGRGQECVGLRARQSG